MKIKVRNNTNIRFHEPIEVYVKVPALSAFALSGSGSISIQQPLTVPTLRFESSGSGNISLWVNKYLDSRISGSGMVRYKGTPQVNVKVSGSGRVQPW